MKFIIIALVLISLTGCMVLFETVEEEITYQVRVDNLTTLDLVSKISGVTIAQSPGMSPYFAATAVLVDGDTTTLVPVYVSESGIPLINRTTARVSRNGVYTLSVYWDELGQRYGYTWVKE